MKNNLGALNEYLFTALDRLGNDDLKGSELLEEIQRAKTITGVASQIIANGQLVLKAKIAQGEHLGDKESMPPLLEG